MAGDSTGNVAQINKVGRWRSRLLDQPLVIEVVVVAADNTHRIVAPDRRDKNVNLMLQCFQLFFLCHCDEAIKLECFALDIYLL